MIERPTTGQLVELADRLGWFGLDATEAAEFHELGDRVLRLLDGLDIDDAGASRTGASPAGETRPSHPSTRFDDPFNAIVRWCAVRRDCANGPLAGVRVAVKDSIAVAGVPMTLGAAVLREFVPGVDAEVTRRLLDAGAEIVATTNMDAFAFTGGGDTTATGPITNPFDESRSAGGSSGGSAAALYYTDAVDATIGSDQGGSIRLPAAWCGVVGLKPTHGLVPYTGIVGIDATFDHAGPMARSVDDIARLLAIIAGADPDDPRQTRTPPFDRDALLEAVAVAPADLVDVRIGVLAEGFSDRSPERSATSASVRAVARRMAAAGAELVHLSVPEHAGAAGIAFAGFVEGMAATLRGGGNGFHWSGRYWPELARALADGLRVNGTDLPDPVKLVALLGAHLERTRGGAIYAMAQNRRPALVAAIDRALSAVDCLLLPTAPSPAYEHIAKLSPSARVLRGWAPLANCSPTDMTGHPAISLPLSSVDGLPVGTMLVGPRFGDAQLVEIATRCERALGWDTVVLERQRRSPSSGRTAIDGV